MITLLNLYQMIITFVIILISGEKLHSLCDVD